jgi:hypothetical protein
MSPTLEDCEAWLMTHLGSLAKAKENHLPGLQSALLPLPLDEVELKLV